jgi:hypothetical protein
MNPFDTNQYDDRREDENLLRPPLPFFIPSKAGGVLDPPSRTEQAINKTSDSLERCFKMLILLAGVLGIIALFPPFLRFLYELSICGFRKVGWLFS